MEDYDLSEPAGLHERVKILSVSPFDEDHESLVKILDGRQWTVAATTGLANVRDLVRGDQFTLVICEHELAPGSWQDVLREIVLVPRAPFLIVTSRHTDNRLWFEAVNLGAYDVLMKPFDRVEVIRTLYLAWVHWKYQSETAARARARAAGG